MTEKKSGIKLFLAGIFPNRGDSRAEFVRKGVLLASFAVLAVCAAVMLALSWAPQSDEKLNSEIRDTKELNENGSFGIPQEKVDEIKQEVPKILDKFVELYAQNKDIVGWVKIEDTPIDYPVLQAADNDYYLTHSFDGTKTISGSLFADCHIPLTYESVPNNIVVYGHNLLSGEYFSKLTYYLPARYGSLDFYKTHPTFEFDTLYEEGTYKVFAGMYINTGEKDGYAYPYHQKRSFKTKAEFMDFVGNILDRSAFYTGVDLEYGDQILTLSTCFFYPLGMDHSTRFVLFARKVRDSESAEVDVSKAYINEDPLYFDAYYRLTGAEEWGGRKWDTSLVKDFDDFNIVSTTK